MTDNDAGRSPLVVTGTHRSGTTWVGQMLAISPQMHYVHEPFNPMHERAWVREPPPQHYRYLRSDSRGPLDDDLASIVALRPPWFHIARRAGGARNAARIAQEAVSTSFARRRGARALIKDPLALLLSEWIADRAQAAIVVLVRHPAAFASSIKRLHWRMDTTHLLAQPELLHDHLEPFRSALELDSRGETDIIEHAALVWRVLNSVIATYESRHPEWVVTRYEDLAVDPIRGFRQLAGQLDIPWTDRMAQEIAERNSPEQGATVPEGSKGGTKRDSARAMWTWTQRLTEEEAERIRGATADVADSWYSDEDWSPPAWLALR